VQDGWSSVLEFVLFIVAWFVVVNFVFPRLGIAPG
jgi:p-aminobenzoyl-glutamate transporter AbgT